MEKADVIVIGSPVYWHNLSGSVRNLLDRFYGPTMSRFAGMYGMEYVGMATDSKEAVKIVKEL